ncbi:MAG: PqqD family protein [Actinobacteria bacterium]|nr:MAG: PqqD family protein [Actinomycetota bacterium]
MILAKSPETAWRVIEGEAMILSLDNKVFRGLNSVGSRVWELIDGRRSVDEIVSQIVGEFEVTAEVASRDVGTFVAELLEKRLVTTTPP